MSLGQREKHTHPRGLTNTVNHGGDVDIVGAVLEPGREVRRDGKPDAGEPYVVRHTVACGGTPPQSVAAGSSVPAHTQAVGTDTLPGQLRGYDRVKTSNCVWLSR